MAYRNLYDELCSFRNLELAYRKARKNKKHKKAVMEFEFNLERNLLDLKHELETFVYKPLPLRQFVISDPKTRVISASHFRDRVVHHALCNVLQPIFERSFIYDSYANRVGKGTHRALERFDVFKRKVSQNGRLASNAKDNNMVIGYALKADIKHFFDTVDHKVLIAIVKTNIKDENVLILIQKILSNYITNFPNKGMPLGNLTSQFFANMYLNELDYFVKQELKVKYYIRYVDDFVILDISKENLEVIKLKIQDFLNSRLKLELHPEKSQIFPLHHGVGLLGFRIFYHYKLLRKSNLREFYRRFDEMEKYYHAEILDAEDFQRSVEGWLAYAEWGDTYRIRSDVKENLEKILKNRKITAIRTSGDEVITNDIFIDKNIKIRE